MRISISEEESKTPERQFFEPGRYTFKIFSAEEKKSKSGNDMIEIVLLHEETGRKVWDYLVITPKSKWRLATLLKACQLPHSGDIDLNIDDLLGAIIDAEIVLQDDPQWGKQNRVKKYMETHFEAPAVSEEPPF